MLGFRGCRLAIAFPEIAEMQARAIFEGALLAKRRTGQAVEPEIMVPLVFGRAPNSTSSSSPSTRWPRAVAKEKGERVPYIVGTMIELPRACLRAAEIAESGGVLLLRHQRPDPDRARHLAGRRRIVPRPLHRQGHPRPRSLRHHRPAGRRRTRRDRRRARSPHPARHQDGHLRGAWRRPPRRSTSASASASPTSPARRSASPIARLAAAQAALGFK